MHRRRRHGPRAAPLLGITVRLHVAAARLTIEPLRAVLAIASLETILAFGPVLPLGAVLTILAVEPILPVATVAGIAAITPLPVSSLLMMLRAIVVLIVLARTSVLKPWLRRLPTVPRTALEHSRLWLVRTNRRLGRALGREFLAFAFAEIITR